ncbi:uncharacterized protein syt18b [Nothobranchius furzeri]|uniref:uncharacterized protein syt18b n=1 Tax=Nothobranchius furzeri TaxID=105023 RepID=UPI002403F832|nr:uncharacterized protein syt18b [Nothobranchius furzeri]
MPYHDEEYPGQPLWQSVLLFCCKGMIEGIMILLFFWLLVQVLFTKQLEVHLQVLLLVGLIIFCLTLILGCIMCWKKSDLCSGKDKAPVPSALPAVEPLNSARSRRPSGATAASRQLYEELDGDLLEYPSTFTSPAPSQSEIVSQPFSDQDHNQRTTYFSVRRLSSPLQTAPLYKPMHPSRASLPSLPSLPKLGMLTRTCKAMQRHSSVTGDNKSYNEHSRLTINSSLMPGNLIPMAQLNYGSNANCKQLFSFKPCLHFTMALCLEQHTLTVTVLNLTGRPQGLEDVTVLGSLPPLHECPTPATTRRSLSPESLSLVLVFNVSSVSEIPSCELRLAVYEDNTQSTDGCALGEVEFKCEGRDWRKEHPLILVKELTANKVNTEKSLQSQTSQDVLRGSSCPPQIFIGLQYQALTHCIKVTVLRAENLQKLVHTQMAADYQVIINLHNEGVLISSRETTRESCTVWNKTSFLFKLPPGDIHQLPVLFEFVIMQCHACSDSTAVGRVRIGADAADAGRNHWMDMCSLQVERARWHIIQPETLQHVGAAKVL